MMEWIPSDWGGGGQQAAWARAVCSVLGMQTSLGTGMRSLPAQCLDWGVCKRQLLQAKAEQE